MSVLFTAASSHSLQMSTTPISGAPLMMGCWFNTTGTSDGIMGIKIDVDHYYILQTNSTPQVSATKATLADGASSVNNTLSITSGTWNYAVALFREDLEIGVAVVAYDGSFQYARGASSGTMPSGTTNLVLGDTSTSFGEGPFDGLIAEVFVADSLPVGITETTSMDGLARKLAIDGPFSIPAVANRVRLYAALRDATNDATIIDRYGTVAQVKMTGTHGGLRPHPPLSATYERPRERYTTNIIV